MIRRASVLEGECTHNGVTTTQDIPRTQRSFRGLSIEHDAQQWRGILNDDEEGEQIQTRAEQRRRRRRNGHKRTSRRRHDRIQIATRSRPDRAQKVSVEEERSGTPRLHDPTATALASTPVIASTRIRPTARWGHVRRRPGRRSQCLAGGRTERAGGSWGSERGRHGGRVHRHHHRKNAGTVRGRGRAHGLGTTRVQVRVPRWSPATGRRPRPRHSMRRRRRRKDGRKARVPFCPEHQRLGHVRGGGRRTVRRAGRTGRGNDPRRRVARRRSDRRKRDRRRMRQVAHRREPGERRVDRSRRRKGVGRVADGRNARRRRVRVAGIDNGGFARGMEPGHPGGRQRAGGRAKRLRRRRTPGVVVLGGTRHARDGACCDHRWRVGPVRRRGGRGRTQPRGVQRRRQRGRRRLWVRMRMRKGRTARAGGAHPRGRRVRGRRRTERRRRVHRRRRTVHDRVTGWRAVHRH